MEDIDPAEALVESIFGQVGYRAAVCRTGLFHLATWCDPRACRKSELIPLVCTRRGKDSTQA